MACQTTIILSEEETELTCICVVAKKQIFRIGYFQNVDLWSVLQQNAFATKRHVTDK
jgi:hypothetical protein